MAKQKIIISILMSLFLISCSQATKKTTAKLKLNLSGITNAGNGIGNGGAILFGKSSTGEQFGKLVSATEQDIELANGDWSFYAVMWEDTTSAGNFKDAVYCGKSAQKLTGTAATVSMSLSNSICTDADFSNGSHYLETKNKFPNLYIEECDELSKSNSFTCLRDNQGSAVSYRMAFKSYSKTPAGALVYTGDVAYSACKATQGTLGMYKQGTGLNFPTSRQAMPFVISVEMFLGSPNCGVTPELKGMYTHTFENGIAADSSAINKVAVSTTPTCSYGPGNQADCEKYFGTWNSTYCSLPDAMMSLFLPVGECAGASSVFTSKSLKQMVSIPKDFLCRNTNFNLYGSDVFPGGDGSLMRPFKICSEWQLNQIGEVYATSSGLYSKSFKLMNDLDMNNADFNAAARPYCIGASGSIYKKHHNLNPIGQSSNGTCDSPIAATAYTGTFNGNNKSIAHARINIGTSDIGFVRSLGSGGVVKNLNFKNLQVEGTSNVGGVAGGMGGSGALISNVKIDGGEIDASGSNAAGVAAVVVNLNKISDVKIHNLNIHAYNKVGGLVAINNGGIERSMFRGRINQHTNMDDSVGGLVGEAGTGSVITASFSEGEIESYSKWTGGITGTNDGAISNAYSNMYIVSKYSHPTIEAFIGGISGGNNLGTITKVYSDGVFSYNGGGAGGSIVDAITGHVGTNAPTDCFASSAYIPISSCLASYDLRSGATTAFIGNSLWKANIADALPRFQWELDTNSRSCLLPENLLTVPLQVAAGKGTFLLPVIICTPTQLKSLSGTPVNRYIKLGEDINISSWGSADLIQTFSGILDGQDYALTGLVFDSSVAGNFGIFANNTGTLSNLKLIGNSLSHNNTGASGILTGVNSGTIRNIFIMGNSLQGNAYAGLVAGSNSIGGLVSDIFVKEGKVDGESYIGGIAGSNEGTITHASVNASLKDRAGVTSYSKFGGITGYNGTSAKIDQSVFSGNINFTYQVPNAVATYIGGLVGYNSGLIENSMTKNYTQINVNNSNSVGGLVGLNNSGAVLRKSFSLGKTTYILGTIPIPSDFGALAGINAGVMTDTMYLENTTGGLIALNLVATVCSQTDVTFPTLPYLTVATPGADLIESVNYPLVGDVLRNYMPFTIPTNDYQIVYNNPATCNAGDAFRLYKSYDPDAAGKTVMDFSNTSTFTNYDIAMESSNPSLALNVDRLIAYYKSEMYGTLPALAPPVWELEEGGDYPRLLQVKD